jgi:hypothetical protein
MWLFFVMAATALLMQACESPFRAFYDGSTAAQLEAIGQPITPNLDGIEVIETASIEQETLLRVQAGMIVLGEANWNGPNTGSASEAREQAKLVGASTVLWSWNYAGSSRGVVPLTTPTTSTTYGSGTVYGTGGSAVWNGSATTYGTTTTYVPYTIHRYDVRTVFLATPIYKPIFGAPVRPPLPEEQARAGTSQGLLVLVVKNGSPAQLAGVLPHDLICKIGDRTVNTLSDFQFATETLAGQSVSVELYRSGQRLVLNATLNRKGTK